MKLSNERFLEACKEAGIDPDGTYVNLSGVAVTVSRESSYISFGAGDSAETDPVMLYFVRVDNGLEYAKDDVCGVRNAIKRGGLKHRT